MIIPEPLTKIRIIGSKNQMKNVIGELYNLKLLHISESPKIETFDIGPPYKEAEVLSNHLVKLRSMMASLKISGKGSKTSVSSNLKKLHKIETDFEKMSKTAEEIKEKINTLQQILNNPLSHIPITPDKIMQLKSIRTFIGIVNKNFLDKLKDADFTFDLTHEIVDNKIAIIFTVPVPAEKKAREFLDKFNFEERRLSEKSYDEAFEELQKLHKESSVLELAFEQFKKENGRMILNTEYTFTIMVEKSEAPLRFLSSKRSFIAEGWLPKKDFYSFEKKISNVANNKISVETVETDENESPPVKLDNPKFAQPFELFLNMHSYPGRQEFDPTMILFLTFSMFFGFMLGDMGYGLLLLIVSIFGIKKFRGTMKSLAYVLAYSSVFSIVFGSMFGEFFGFEVIHAVINRFEEVNKMLFITASIGFVHVTAGLILGFITKFKEHGLMTAIFEKGSWMIIELSILLFILGFAMHVKIANYIGIVTMLSGIGMLFKGEGIRGVIELPSLVSNILSYLRLFAVGLASVALAMVVNDMTISMFKGGIVGGIAGIGIFLLGHTINILLGLLGPFLHSLRLHYYEFFTKFFEGGGKQYNPFGKINEWR